METRRGPLVSIVITTYNRGDVLGESIDSALGQSYSNIEVIVVDDGSSDNTPELMKAYGSRIVSYRQPNRGYAAARNTGLRLARGKYLAWLDSDDIFHPEKIAMQVAYLEQHPEAVLISTDFAGFDASGPREDSVRTYYSAIMKCGDASGIYSVGETLDLLGTGADERTGLCRVWSGRVLQSLLQGSFVHPPTVMMRREAAVQAGELDESLVNSVEYRFFFKLARLGTFAFIDKPLLDYRFSPGQFSGKTQSESMSTSILRIMQELPHTDPDVVKAEPRLYARRLAETYLDMAYVFADRDRQHALRGVFESMRHGVMTAWTFRVLARVLLSKGARDQARRLMSVTWGRTTGAASSLVVLNYDAVVEFVAGCC